MTFSINEEWLEGFVTKIVKKEIVRLLTQEVFPDEEYKKQILKAINEKYRFDPDGTMHLREAPNELS